jgi:tetratricopeptide (TPR) repeat protein
MPSIPEDAYGYAQLRIKTALRRLQKSLNLSDKKLRLLPPSIRGLTELQSLDLSANRLRSLPPEIGQLTNLQTLDLSTNDLASIPAEIGHLAALKFLNLSKNQLNALPPEIGQLAALQSLDLRGNPLKALPPELQQLKTLRHLSLSDTPLFLSAQLGADQAKSTLAKTLRRLAAIIMGLLSFITKGGKLLMAAVTFLVVLALISVIWDAIVDVEIEQIAVPEVLTKVGYTPEGTARRLRDAMSNRAVDVGIRYIGEGAFISSDVVTISGSVKYPLASDQPSLVVPTIGLSTDVIARLIRKTSVFNWILPAHHTISGEITNVASKLQLRLRNDGEVIYFVEDADASTPEDLIEPGIDAVLAATDPYFKAAIALRTDPDQSQKIVESAILRWSTFPASLWSRSRYIDLLFIEGAILQSQYNFEKAITIYNDIAKYSKQGDPRVQLHLGLINLLRGYNQEAACQFLGGIDLLKNDQANSTNGDLFIGLARALTPRGLIKGADAGNCPTEGGKMVNGADQAGALALLAYQRAAALNPLKASSFFKWGAALEDQGKYDDAEEQYKKAIDANPRYSRAYFNLGGLLLEQGRIAEAKEKYDLAVKFDSSDGEAHYYLGSVLHDLSRRASDKPEADKLRIEGDRHYKLAEDIYGFVILNDQTSYNRNHSYFNLGTINVALGDNHLGIQNYDKVIDYSLKSRKGVDYSRVFGFRGYAYFNMGEFERAEEEFTRALTEGTNTYFMLWKFLAERRGRPQSQMNASRDALRGEAVRRSTDHNWPGPVLEMFLGERSIESTYDAAGSNQGRRCEANFYIGEWYLVQNNRDGAESSLKQAVEVCPELFHEFAGAEAELERFHNIAASFNVNAK